MPERATRRRFLLGAAAASLGAAVGCQGVCPTIFGYSVGNAALYDQNIRTVYVRMCENRAFQTTPNRGLEVDITAAVVREIGAKTPFRVISDPNRADTELLMNIVDINKNILNRTQQNTIREGEVIITLDVLWRDLRTGKVLSNTRAPVDPNVIDPIPPFDPNVPVAPPVSDVPVGMPTRLVATGRLLQELGETNSSADQRAVNSLATQIVSLMEKPW